MEIKKLVGDIDKLNKGRATIQMVQESMHHFPKYTWYFDAKKAQYVNSLMNAEEKDIFFMDLENFDFDHWSQQLPYGIQKYLMGQDVPESIKGETYRQVIRKNQFPLGYALRVAGRGYKFNQKERSTKDYFETTLHQYRNFLTALKTNGVGFNEASLI